MKWTVRFATGSMLVAILAACARPAPVAVVPGAQAVARETLVPPRAAGTTLRVASFNILYGTKEGFEWSTRRESASACVRDMNPDVFGVQEALWSQLEDLMDTLPGYTCVGRGRDDGEREGEVMAIFYRTERFVLHSAATFWLSDTPEMPGSNTWGAACNRTATVAILIDRTDGKTLGVCNTHLDHVSGKARDNGSALIRRRLAMYGKNLAWVVTGDFNARPDSRPHENLVGPAGEVKLVDTFATVHPSAPSATSSFHGYAGKPRAGSRIDWILASPHFEPLAGDINQFEYRGRLPSDHYPVWADLKRIE